MLTRLSVLIVGFTAMVLVPFLGAVDCPTPCCDTPRDEALTAQADGCCESGEGACETQSAANTRSTSEPRTLDVCTSWDCCDLTQSARPAAPSLLVTHEILAMAASAPDLPPTLALTPGLRLGSHTAPPWSLPGPRVHLQHCVLRR